MGKFLGICTTNDFSRRTQLHGVVYDVHGGMAWVALSRLYTISIGVAGGMTL
jgi:hypothetical protein